MHEPIILKHLKENGTITSFEAFNLYGITRLASSICKLRRKGYAITTTMLTNRNRYGAVVNYAMYRLEDNK